MRRSRNTPLDRKIQKRWSAPVVEPPCRIKTGITGSDPDSNCFNVCIKCGSRFGQPCREEQP